MNWITNYVRPKIGSFLTRSDMPDNLWIKCPESGEMVFYKDLEKNMGVIPASGYHMRITAVERLTQFFDNGEYELFDAPVVATDPLKFRDKTRYLDKLKDARRKTEQEDSILAASGLVNGIKMIAVVHEMSFIGGSLGMAAGETIVKAMQKAAEEKCALALFAASGGARMQEGIFSLMQMPRTTIARQMMKDAGAPYIVVLTNPTTGGVSASYAMLGDVHIAEPGAVIGFAGRRVIEQTIREKLPDDFQTSEYLLEHGMIDMIVERAELKPTISRIVRMMLNLPALEIEPEPVEPDETPDKEDASDKVISDEVETAAAKAE